LLEEIGAIDVSRTLRIADRELRAFVRRGGRESAVLPQGIELQVEVRTASIIEKSFLRHREHTLHDLHDRLFRREPLAHELNGEERTAHTDVRLASARRAGSADGVVAVLARPDDRRIANATRDLPRDAA